MNQVAAVEGPAIRPDAKRHVTLLVLCAAKLQQCWPRSHPTPWSEMQIRALNYSQFVPCLLRGYVFAGIPGELTWYLMDSCQRSEEEHREKSLL